MNFDKAYICWTPIELKLQREACYYYKAIFKQRGDKKRQLEKIQQIRELNRALLWHKEKEAA